MSILLPNYQDEVQHKKNETRGVVIAVYEIGGIKYFDVRSDEHIHYKTIAANWKTVVAYVE